MNWEEARGPIFELNAVELDTLKAIAAGLSIPEASKMRFITENTVRSQRKKLYRKMGVGNGYLAVARGYHWGLLDPDIPPEVALEQHQRYPERLLPKRPRKPSKPRPAPLPPRTLQHESLYERFPALAMLEARAKAGVGPVVRED